MELSILFFALYLSVVILIGWIASRKETEEGFMLAERKVAGVQLAASLTAGFFDGATLSIYLAYVYQFGLSAAWLFLGFGMGFLVLRYFAVRIKRNADALGVYSLPEYFYRTIGKWSGVMFSVILVIAIFLLLIVNLIVSGQVLSTIFPLSYPLSVAIGGGVILTYLFLAGFKAVVRTDTFQFLIMIVMSVTVGLYLFGKSTIPAADLDPVALGGGNLVAFFLLGALSAVVGPDLWQRIFAAKDETTLRRGLAYGACIIPLLAVIIGVMGLATKQFLPGIAPEQALVQGFSHLLPFGLKEFGMVLLYAVSLSSSDTFTFVISSIVTRDLLNYSERFQGKSMRSLTRVFMISLIVLAGGISIVYQDILTIGFAIGGIGIALAPALLLSFRYKLHDRAVGGSLFLAFLSIVILFVLDDLSPETALLSLPVAFLSLLLFQGIARYFPHALAEKQVY